ncbi:biotin carboxylase [Oikeobacillus pervagus]|uniref:Biotin carboxylase n=1 Tax=Oikeobacillus pervagus TaxID=1325931 RepID=A0AAJ1SZR4_9BACI|nr:ATP-grasp domain-containing protein [Oikeobacillus pervagus]MDQ0215845.1 biotin carboxylase [Oikeobacillus pervagus]
MKTIIFIGTNKSGSSREAVKAAEKMGYFTVVFTNREKQMEQRVEYPDVHEMIFIESKDLSKFRAEIKKLLIRGIEIEAIVSFVDSYVYMAMILCNEFCKKATYHEAIKIMENKEQTRSFLKDQSYTPNFFIIKKGESVNVDFITSQFEFPLIIKSPKSTGSKDVLFAEKMEQLQKHIVKLQEKNPNESLVIEEYIDGNQYLVEAIVYQNKVHIIAIIEQEITKNKRFIVTGYGIHAKPPYYLKVGIETVLHSIISQFGIQNGALHLELRYTKSGWKLIEINPRISGGAMNKMIQSAFGINLVRETLQLYLGNKPSLIPQYNQYVFTQYLIVSRKGMLEKVTGRARARRSPGVVEVYVKPKRGSKLSPPLSMGHRYAYVIAVGDSMGEAKKNAKTAAKEIEFHLAPAQEIEITITADQERSINTQEAEPIKQTNQEEG